MTIKKTKTRHVRALAAPVPELFDDTRAVQVAVRQLLILTNTEPSWDDDVLENSALFLAVRVTRS